MTCSCGCGRPVHARGLAVQCYNRWRYHGCPEGVPAPVNPGNDRRRPDRVEDYQWLREQGCSREDAARRLNVCMRTVERYDAEIRAAGMETEKAGAA